jgi:U3 small nucleolar RNA-associated protein 22
MKHFEGLPDRSALIDRTEWSAPALVDPTASLNLLASLAAGSLEHVAAEAKASLALLDLGGDHFSTLFLSDRSQPSFVFDEVARFRLSSASVSAALAADAGSRLAAAARLVASVARRGLGRRAAYSTVLVSAPPSLWAVDAERPKQNADVQLGVVLEPTEALKMVEHGPAPEDAAAAQAFKDFWGPLAELRRFRDGRIVESVVWPSAGPFARWRIPRDIVRHVLQRHCNVEAKKVHFFAERFSGLLEVPKEVERLAALEPTEASGFQLVQASFQELVKNLRALEGLPLSLVSVVPTAESLRSTSAFVPFPLRLDALGTRVPDTASYLPLHDIVMTLESSGRWPDDVPAIQAMKAAFYEKMAGLLPEHMAGSRACVVYDVDAATQGPLADTSALEIVTSTGFAFRARIHHERERTLLERIIASRDETPARKREARSALVRFAQRFDSATRHHATVATLQARLIALGEATRLLKRWVSAQMLSHISPELLELLALHVFLQPGAQPHSAAAGFARTLQTLATWRWRDEPLLVACHAAVDAPEGEVVAPRFPLELAAQAEKALKTVRSQDPSKETRTWLIATEKDIEGTDWASRGPTAAEAHLLQQLAAGAVQYLSAKSASLTAADVMVRRLCATRTSCLADTAPFRRSSRPR